MKKSTFRDHLRSEAQKSAAKSAFERRYNSEMEDEGGAPDAVHPRFTNDYGDKYKGLHALPDNQAGTKEFPRTARGQEAVRNFRRAYLRD